MRRLLGQGTIVAILAVLGTVLVVPAPAQAETSPGWRELSNQVAVRPLGAVSRAITVQLATETVTPGSPVSLVVTFRRTVVGMRRAALLGRQGTSLVTLDTASCRQCGQLTVQVPGSAVTDSQKVFYLRVGPSRFAVKIDGRSLDGTLDTRMQVTNGTSTRKLVRIGSGCIDPLVLLPVAMRATASTAVVGSCALRPSDVQGAFLVGDIINGYQPIDFFAGNPIIGYPWIEVDGVKHNFSEGESCAFTAQGQVFEASRGTDLPAAKDMRLNWVESTTLAPC